MENLICHLLSCYREDLKDYEIILEQIEKLEKFLENKSEAGSAEKMEADQLLEQELAAFAASRDEAFRRLQERSGQLKVLQKAVCQKIGAAEFHLSKLKPFLQAEVWQELSLLMDDLDKKMRTVLELDGRLIPRLRMELEAVKLELHRFQGAKKTKNAYGNSGRREARFIDKTK